MKALPFLLISAFAVISNVMAQPGRAAGEDKSAPASPQQEAASLWTSFLKGKESGVPSLLPDFSYAGYHFSEKALPDLRGRRLFDVTHFGAIPDDDNYDDEAIQKAIHAAEAVQGGGIVFFPPGKYMIAPDEDPGKAIRIRKSNIVLKGSGSGPGGSEIFQDKKRINGRQFLFKPDGQDTPRITIITKDAPAESFWVEVASVTGLSEGQDVVIRHRSEAFTRHYFGDLPLKPDWSRLFGPRGGMQVFEIHTISEISGNRLKFQNPLHFDLKVVKDADFELCSYTSLQECGIEDLRFTSNWKSYPEDFVHHKDAIHDYAWEAVGMEYLKDSWVRNCVFRDWNECIFIRSGYRITVLNCDFEGKKGHSSVHARTGYGVLIKQCRFHGAHHHGPGTGYSASGTVITQCILGADQNIDSHSGQPFATLFDDIDGGVFYNLGGPLPGFPHHGKGMVFWNFQHRSARKHIGYDFWDTEKRRNYTIALPIFAGFRSDNEVTLINYGINESQGKSVRPQSLFEAQLLWRLQGKAQSR